MSLKDVPGEIFDLIVNHVTNADHHSLRIVCRSFKARLDPKYHPEDFFDRFSHGHKDHNDFLRLLFSPGNLFHGHDVVICGTCSRVRPKNKFPMETLRVNDFRVCENCVSHLVLWGLSKGQKHTHRGLVNYTCARCGLKGYDISEEEGYGGQMYRHETIHTPNQPRLWRFCYRCHMDVCRNDKCPGWPEGFPLQHMFHFYRRPVVEHWQSKRVCTCKWCLFGKRRFELDGRPDPMEPPHEITEESEYYGKSMHQLYFYDEYDPKDEDRGEERTRRAEVS